MNTFKQVCKKNWYVIAATLLFVICSKVLVGIMLHDFKLIYRDGPYYFYTGIVARLFVLVAGVLIAYFLAFCLNSKHSLTISVISSFFCLCYADYKLNDYIRVDSLFFAFFFITATVSLAFYYVNHCKNSTQNTVRYMLVLTFLALLTYEEAEFYTILASHIFLFITNHKSFEKMSVSILNWISAGVSSAVFVYVLVMQIIDDKYYKPLEEETVFIMEKMMSNLKPFGKSEFFDEFLHDGYDYNILKIFGYYGYVAGTAIVILFVLFVAGVLIGCIRSQGKIKLAAHIGAITLAVRSLASVLEVLGILWFFESNLMIVSFNSNEYVIAGLIIGLVFASDKEMILNKGEATGNQILSEK